MHRALVGDSALDPGGVPPQQRDPAHSAGPVGECVGLGPPGCLVHLSLEESSWQQREAEAGSPRADLCMPPLTLSRPGPSGSLEAEVLKGQAKLGQSH